MEEDANAGAETVFRAYGQTLETVSSFKYLRMVLTASYYDWTELVSNLRKSRGKWNMMSMILGREGEDSQTSGMFYNAVMQANLLIRSENLVVIPRVGHILGGFQHRVAHSLVEMKPQ